MVGERRMCVGMIRQMCVSDSGSALSGREKGMIVSEVRKRETPAQAAKTWVGVDMMRRRRLPVIPCSDEEELRI